MRKKIRRGPDFMPKQRHSKFTQREIKAICQCRTAREASEKYGFNLNTCGQLRWLYGTTYNNEAPPRGSVVNHSTLIHMPPGKFADTLSALFNDKVAYHRIDGAVC